MSKKDQVVTYPVIVSYEPDGSEYPYLVTIPDLGGAMTQGKSVTDAIAMAEDFIGTTGLTEALPPSNYLLPKVGTNETVTLVKVNVSEYRRLIINRT